MEQTLSANRPKERSAGDQGTGNMGDGDARERKSQAAPVIFMDSSRSEPGS